MRSYVLYSIIIAIGISFNVGVYHETYYDWITREPQDILVYDKNKINNYTYYIEDLPKTDLWNAIIVKDAFYEWEKLNDNLIFTRVTNQTDFDILIDWDTAVYSSTNHTKIVWGQEKDTYRDGKRVNIITIDYVDNCNDDSLYFHEQHIKSVLKHEIGHALGIMEHTSVINSTLYSHVDGIDDLDTLGLEIPIDDYYTVGTYMYQEEKDLLRVMGDPDKIYEQISNKTFTFIKDTENRDEDKTAYLKLREIIDCKMGWSN